jgi:hypothetical protein
MIARLSNVLWWAMLGLALMVAYPVFAAEKRVCVEVKLIEPADGAAVTGEREKAPQPQAEPLESYLKSSRTAGADTAAGTQARTSEPAAAGPYLPIGQTPVGYLQRLVEHFVTHESGYIAVREQCEETMRVEMYPLEQGWTVFARYTGTGREERVDQLFPDELSQFAERAVLALLHGQPISATINRDTVLRGDSKKSQQRIKGTHHFMLSLGTQLRGGNLASATAGGGAAQKIRLFSPMTISAGYRGKFENWGIESLAQVGIGTSKTALSRNPQGGVIDFGGDVGLALHFLRYFNPRGINSFYLGAGANFELLWFSAIKNVDRRLDGDRDTLLSGGLDVDLVAGWEFLRASSVQFFLQGEVSLPAYQIQTGSEHGGIQTWFPGLAVKLGVMF